MARKAAKQHGSRTFFLSFFLSFLIFGIIFLAAYLLVIKPETPVDSSNSDVLIEDEYLPDEKDDMSVLLVGCKEQNLTPQFYMLMKFDAVREQVEIVPLPKEAYVTVNVKTKTLEGHYTFGGVRNAVNAAANLFLIDVDRYIRIDQAGIKTMVDYFGGFRFTLQSSVKTDSYDLKAGEQLLDGNRVSELLMKGEPGLNAELMAAYFSTCWNRDSLSRLKHYTQTLFEVSDTDLTREDIQFQINPINQLFRKEGDKTEVFYLEGSYSQKRDIFTPDKDSVERIAEVFRDKEPDQQQQSS